MKNQTNDEIRGTRGVKFGQVHLQYTPLLTHSFCRVQQGILQSTSWVRRPTQLTPTSLLGTPTPNLETPTSIQRILLIGPKVWHPISMPTRSSAPLLMHPSPSSLTSNPMPLCLAPSTSHHSLHGIMGTPLIPQHLSQHHHSQSTAAGIYHPALQPGIRAPLLSHPHPSLMLQGLQDHPQCLLRPL